MAGLSEPLPFITLTDDETFEISPEAASYLSSLEGEISIVAIAGLYRTGKSYLLNQLLGRTTEHTMFGVGGTVNAMTKGIWIWGQPMDAATSSSSRPKTIIFMDTEGLGSSQRSQTQDTRIFALALLLSSFFIYNSRGVIDANAIEDLSLVVNLTKYIQVSAGGADSSTSLADFFPSFLWVVRDFTLQLEEEGRAITPRDYLEKALKPQPGSSDDALHKNQVRALLAAFFPDRDCLTMVRPLNDELLLRELPKQPLESLRPEFQAQLTTLHKKVFSTLKPKKLMAKALSGAMLVTLARNYVDAFNSGATPVISSAWDRVVAAQSEQALESAKAAFTDALALPSDAVPEATLVSSFQVAQEAAQNVLRAQDFAGDAFASVLHTLGDWLDAQLGGALEVNMKRATAHQRRLLDELYAPISAKAQVTMDRESPVAMLHETLKNYKIAMAGLVEAYDVATSALPLHAYVLTGFLADKAMDSIVEWGTAVTMSFRAKDTAAQKALGSIKQKVSMLESKAQAAQDMLAQQRETFERALFGISERMADEKMALTAEIDHKTAEIARTAMQIERIGALHAEAHDRLLDELARAKAECADADDALEAARQEQLSLLADSTNQRLEQERMKNAKEATLLAAHQELLHKTIALERELGDQQAEQMLATFKAEQAVNEKLLTLRHECEDQAQELKTRTITEIRAVKAKHEGELKSLQLDLNERQAVLSALQERLEAKRRMNLQAATKTPGGRKEDCVLQ
ncbi:hypothetical protein SPRG_06766 [Saprolegnia parasitica CBS 223.65]|uniref:GB1/RHD3-type G domain-containing protein n=1 Tax=Saprolegnia parasitica (strain CBS 223.65) TaxID=695850 RepID=A0A067CMN0_SAPPC|nr:hypothetical protein SPRG_06766 [Saprolegnia parasitica CBS 223.65]KDO28077.1 hypothetical protein SPRG_06766 [Saprolegnia parasitica CBS 223.65]|eukprot:XP_012201162.1 hypothetical protein SPRG_06766 [Saprolegnia parasitica CBS 223.65]